MTTVMASALGPHTLDEWHEARQPLDGGRLELLRGSWSVSPAPDAGHQYAGDELRELFKYALKAAGRSDLRTMTATGCDISTHRRDGTIPDVLVTSARPVGPVPGATVELLVEIWSPGNGVGERAEKRAAYAAAGVPFFWEVTTDGGGPATLLAQHLVDGHYRSERTVTTADGPVTVTAAPVPVEVSLAELRF